jgi:hypothetical protein
MEFVLLCHVSLNAPAALYPPPSRGRIMVLVSVRDCQPQWSFFLGENEFFSMFLKNVEGWILIK